MPEFYRHKERRYEMVVVLKVINQNFVQVRDWISGTINHMWRAYLNEAYDGPLSPKQIAQYDKEQLGWRE